MRDVSPPVFQGGDTLKHGACPVAHRPLILCRFFTARFLIA